MRRTGYVVLLMAVGACGGDGAGPGGAVIGAELAGTWEASPACFPACGFTFENTADPADTLNFTGQFGTTSRLTLSSGGSFTFDPGIAGVPSIAGRMHTEGTGTLVVEATVTTPEERITYSLSGGYLALVWQDTYTFNIDGEAGDENVRVRGRFEKQ